MDKEVKNIREFHEEKELTPKQAKALDEAMNRKPARLSHSMGCMCVDCQSNTQHNNRIIKNLVDINGYWNLHNLVEHFNKTGSCVRICEDGVLYMDGYFTLEELEALKIGVANETAPKMRDA